MLYTGKGDRGTTTTFGCDQRISKGSATAEALGTLDELNSFLGLCKLESERTQLFFENRSAADLVQGIQENLFIIQAEIAGAEKTIIEEKLREAERIINGIEGVLPPITSFFISGGTELAARFDVARTLARRAERRVISVVESGERNAGEWTIAYLNRLSSLLYALARFSNHTSGIVERPPSYQ